MCQSTMVKQNENSFLLRLIRLYMRWLSPLLPSSCRYYPTCSAYAYEAIAHYGCLKGSWLALRRLASCHPWSAGGYAPLRKTDQKQNG